MAIRIADSVRTNRVDQIKTAIDAGAGAGLLRIYSGSKPSKGGTPSGLLLAEITLADPCGTSSGGVLTLSSMPRTDTSANNTGTAAFFYLVDSTGAFVCDGDIATSGSDLNLTTTSITSGQPVEITSFTITDGNN